MKKPTKKLNDIIISETFKEEIRATALRNLRTTYSRRIPQHGIETTTFKRPSLKRPGYARMLVHLYEKGPAKGMELKTAVGVKAPEWGHHCTSIQRLTGSGMIEHTDKGYKITDLGRAFVETNIL